MNIIFLDIDGVLNCQLFYNSKPKGSYVQQNICVERVGWMNELCDESKSKVVISSTWRLGRTIDELKEIFLEVGGRFEIIGITPHLKHEACVRGNEIEQWIKNNPELVGPYYDYKSYVIIDDDSDMLYSQRNNLFLTDSYSGLTPNTCYRVKRFLNQSTFPY